MIEKRGDERFVIILYVLVAPEEKVVLLLEQHVHVVHESHVFLMQTHVPRKTCCTQNVLASDGYSTYMYMCIHGLRHTLSYVLLTFA